MVGRESECGQAIINMQAYDPHFDLNELEAEAGDIFAEFYCNFLTRNLDYLKEVSGGVALGKCKADF